MTDGNYFGARDITILNDEVAAFKGLTTFDVSGSHGTLVSDIFSFSLRLVILDHVGCDRRKRKQDRKAQNADGAQSHNFPRELE